MTWNYLDTQILFQIFHKSWWQATSNFNKVNIFQMTWNWLSTQIWFQIFHKSWWQATPKIFARPTVHLCRLCAKFQWECLGIDKKNCPLSLLFSTNSTYHLLSTTDYFRHLFGKCIDWTKATPAGPGPVANGFTDLASGSTPLAHGFLVPSVLHWDSPMYMVKSLMVQSQVHLGVKLARGTVTIIPLLGGG